MAVPLAVFEFEAPGTGDGQREPIDPPRLVGPAVLLEPGSGEPFDAMEFRAVDRAQRAAVTPGAAGLDLAEDDHVRGSGDEVELPEPVPPVPGQDLHPVALQMRGGELFAEASELVRGQIPEVHKGPRWR
jgi:hypothetical protein